MRQLNSEYALYYRKKYGGRGYVFQDRFKSTLIKDEKYLFTAIIYTLLNPVRANIVNNPYDYTYSSINEYFNYEEKESITDRQFVEYIIGDKENILELSGNEVKIDERNSKFGKILGDKGYEKEIEYKINRRGVNETTPPRMRKNERTYRFLPHKKIIEDFEKKIKMKIQQIPINKISGKRIRMKLLAELREKCGLTYREINQISIFNNLKLYSLSHLYQCARTTH